MSAFIRRFFVINFLLVVFLLLPASNHPQLTTHAKTSTSSATVKVASLSASIAQVATPSANYQPLGYTNPQSPQYADLLVNNLLHAFSCLMTGTSPIGQKCINYLNGVPVISSTNNNGGLLGLTSNMLTLVISNPPVRTGQYLATLEDSIGLVKKADAQVTGSGNDVLKPIEDLWQISRNISYAIMTVIFLVIGLMIMFRQRVNPQTVISVQAALPGLVIGLVMITFSYFLASILIDTSYLATNLVGYYFQAALPTSSASTTNLVQKTSNESILTIFGRFTGAIESKHTVGAVETIWDSLPDSTRNWLRAAAALVTYQFGSGAGGNIDIPGLGFLIGLASVAATQANITGTVGQILFFVAMFALIVQMLKLLLKLVNNYLSIIFYTITAPFQFLFASLPGRQGIITDWIRNMLCNILAFPAVLAVLYFVAYLLGPESKSTNDFFGPFSASATITGTSALPLFGGLNTGFVRVLLAYGALVATPTIPDLICQAIGKIGRAGQVIGQEIEGANKAGQGWVQRGGQGIGQVAGGIGSYRDKYSYAAKVGPGGTEFVKEGTRVSPGIGSWLRGRVKFWRPPEQS